LFQGYGEAGLVSVSSTAIAAISTATAAAAIAAAATSAAASAIAATAAAASTAATTTATESAAVAAVFAGTGFIDGKGAALMLSAVQGGDGRLGLGVAGHLDESESLAPASIAVVDDLGRNNLPMSREQLFQHRAINVVAQVSDVQLLTHCVSPSNG
jgi:hypothetical protein